MSFLSKLRRWALGPSAQEWDAAFREYEAAVRRHERAAKDKGGRPKGWFADLGPKEREETRERLREASRQRWSKRPPVQSDGT